MTGGPLPAVVIAAGESRRMGRPKALLPLGSRTVLQRVVGALEVGAFDPIIVVLGHRSDEVAASLAGMPACTVVNERYAEGMLSSVQRGAGEVPADAAAWLLALGDQPDIRPDALHAMVGAWRAHPGSVVVPVVGGRRGHPILIDASYRGALQALRPPQTLRDLVHSPDTHLVELPLESPGLLLDLDTPDDYAAALRSGRFDD